MGDAGVVAAEVRNAARSRWVNTAARAGLAAKGLLYAVIAVLAVRLALGGGGQSADQQGALRALAQQPFGRMLLVGLAAGLAGYALWRLAQAVLGPADAEGVKAVAVRLSFMVRALIYAALSLTTVGLLTGVPSAGGGEDSMTASLLRLPFGAALVAATGVVIIGVALYQGGQALSRDFREDLAGEKMSQRQIRVAVGLGVAGHLSRMAVFALVGLFLIRAAVTFDPDEAIGFDGALREIASASHGKVLLLVVASGLACYGCYSLVLARFGRPASMD